jgi:hypothetical protein
MAMRTVVIAICLLACTFICRGDVKTHIRNIRVLISEQRQELDDTRSRLTWTWNELQTAQGQVAQVGWERDWYREHYEQDEVELAKFRKHGIFGGILSAVGLVFSFVANPFAFIVNRALQVVFGLGLALIIFAVAFSLIRRIRRTHTK